MNEKVNIQKMVTWYNMIFCVFVIWIHTKNTDLFSNTNVILATIQNFIVENIAVVAVGGFYICSGYLCFRNINAKKIPEKMKRRAFSLGVPYLVWNLIYYLFHCLVIKVPLLSGYYEEIPLNLDELVNAVLFYKYNPIFWYMQYLIVFVIMCPCIYLILKNKWIGGMSIFALWGLAEKGIVLNVNPTLSYMINWLVLYMAGAFLGMHCRNLVEEHRKGNLEQIITILGTLFSFGLFKIYTSIGTTLLYYFFFSIMVWCLLKKVEELPIKSWMENTFFIYAVHFMIVRFVNKIAAIVLGNSTYVGMGIFLLAPIMVFAICEILRKILKKYAPCFWKILSGNR